MPNFYRLWIGAEALLSMILREVMRRMVAQKIIGVILTIGEKMIFLTLISKYTGSRNARTSRDYSSCGFVVGSATVGCSVIRRTSSCKTGVRPDLPRLRREKPDTSSFTLYPCKRRQALTSSQ